VRGKLEQSSIVIDLMSENKILATPKQGKERGEGRAGWYRYYAGFSPKFVESAIGFTSLHGESTILDPWNGSGTTTSVARAAGYRAFGYDLNPTMVIVSKAKSIDATIAASISTLMEEILSRSRQDAYIETPDPLEKWLTTRTAKNFRSIERALFSLLIDRHATQFIADFASLENVSSLAAFFYLGLFRSLRTILGPFQSSNPTWIRTAPRGADKVTRSRPTDVPSIISTS
jgi:hypothetical protein